MKAHSLFDLILKEEIDDIVASQLQDAAPSKNEFGDDDGNIYFPMSRSFNELKTEFGDFSFDRDFQMNSSSTSISMETFRSDFLESEVKTIAYTKKDIDLDKFLANIYKEPSIYGVLIQSNRRSDYLINPLHPLVAMSIKMGQLSLPEKGKIIVYSYRSPRMEENDFQPSRAFSEIRTEDDLHNFLNNHQNYSKIFDVYQKLIQLSKYFVTHVKVETELETNMDEYYDLISESVDFISQLYLVRKIHFTEKSTQEKIQSMIVPFQAAISNMATPYYGVGFIDNPTSSENKGYNIGIMASGNLRHERADFSDVSVCTGSRPRSKPTGWLTLSRVNLSSMWYANIITNDKKKIYALADISKFLAGKFYELSVSDSAADEENASS